MTQEAPGQDAKPAHDALAYEVAQHRLNVMVHEAGTRAARSAGSAFVSGHGSCASAIFTLDGRQVAQTPAGQHVAALRAMMPHLLEKYPAAEMREGDVFLCNDPFRGGIHPTDLACFRPVFWQNQVVYFSGMMMIVGDMGGMSSGGLPANATETFHEGLALPPLRVTDAGIVNDAAMTIILANSRVPQKLRADIDALVGACFTVTERMREMIERYGLAELGKIIERILDHTEAILRNGIAAIPDGEYFGAYTADDDGVGPAPCYEVKVRIKIEGSHCLFDFTGTANQAVGAINSSLSQSMSFVTFSIQHYIDPDIEINEGFYRPIEMIFPLGSVLNPLSPAACNMRFSVGQALVDAIHQALRPVFPHQSIAPSSSITTLTANCATPGAPPWAMLDVSMGPGGGRSGADANDGLPCQMAGMPGYMPNVEVYEMNYPVLYERFAFVPDSGGPGEWRGGAGTTKEIRFFEDATVTFRSVDRTKRLPLGANGGGTGKGGGWIINPGQPDEQFMPAKLTNHRIKAGDLLRGSVVGAGGYGEPWQRDPQRVAYDVRKKVVSPAGAQRDYGVVVTAAGEVDEAATQTLRSSHKEI